MATITITLNTSAKQDEKLAKVLETLNENRAAQNLPPFETIQAYFKDLIIQATKSYVDQRESFEAGEVAKVFKDSSDAVQGQVRAILGME